MPPFTATLLGFTVASLSSLAGGGAGAGTPAGAAAERLPDTLKARGVVTGVVMIDVDVVRTVVGGVGVVSMIVEAAAVVVEVGVETTRETKLWATFVA